tara:strand:- start:804 stop:1334 length:531 start_codon:yes stop_codon:yes gene_type:complete
MNKRRYKSAAIGAFGGWVGIVLIILLLLLSSCYGTYYITDSEFDDAREEHVNITYYNGNVYWGYHQGYWYYYGKPHFYPWYYYYTVCPPVSYSVNYHVHINRWDNGLPIRRPKRNKLFNNSGNVRVWNIKEQSVTDMQTIPNNKRPNINRNNIHHNNIMSPKPNRNKNKVTIKRRK